VFRDGLGFAVKDLGSRNGLEVNGVIVKDMARLKSGDKVKIGGFVVRFVDPKAAVADLQSSVPDLSAIDQAAPGEKGGRGGGGAPGAGAPADTAPGGPAKPETVRSPLPPPAAAAAARAGAEDEEEAKTSPLVYLLIVVAIAVVAGMGVLVWKALQ